MLSMDRAGLGIADGHSSKVYAAIDLDRRRVTP
jgi:hypothetical protein